MVTKGINSFRVSWRERVPNCIFCSLYCHTFCIHNHLITRIGGLPMMPVKGFWVTDIWLKTASWVQFVAACEMNAKILPIQTAQCIGTAYAFDVLFKTSCTWYAFSTIVLYNLLFSATCISPHCNHLSVHPNHNWFHF